MTSATVDHAYDLAKRMKQSDIDEVLASHGASPVQAAVFSLLNSQDGGTAFTVLADGEAHIMFGVLKTGMVWMLSSEEPFSTPEYTQQFIKESKLWIDDLHNLGHERLYNYIDERNKKSRAWLRHCGFKEVERIEAYGAAQIPFILIESRR